MKRHGMVSRLAIFSLIVGLVSSCSLMAPQTGKLSIPFPASILGSGTSASGKALDSRSTLSPGGKLGTVRIYLESMGGLIPLAGSSPIFEAGIPATNSITIDGLPQLRNCVLFLALSEGSGSDFRAVKYATSGFFNIVPGVTTSVNLTAQTSPFSDIYTGGDPEGVRALVLGNTTYYLAGGSLSAFDAAGNAAGSLVIVGKNGITRTNNLGSGKIMNSDGSFGADALWISTDNGVWALSGTGASMSIAQLQIKNGSGALIDVGEIDSACSIQLTYTDNTVTPSATITQNVVFYQGPHGRFGVAYSSGDGWGWFDLSDNLDKLGSTLKDSITSSDRPLIADYSIDSSSRFGYLSVPAINNFRVGGDVVQKIKDLGADPPFDKLMDTVLKNNTMALPSVSGAAPQATSVSEVTTSSGRVLYIGTDRGAFAIGGIGTDGMLIDSAGAALLAQPIALGKIVSVAKLRATLYGGNVWTAILGRGGTLYLLKNGNLAATYPFYSGLPAFGDDARATGDLFWTDQGLMISGKNGVVLMKYAQLPN